MIHIQTIRRIEILIAASLDLQIFPSQHFFLSLPTSVFVFESMPNSLGRDCNALTFIPCTASYHNFFCFYEPFQNLLSFFPGNSNRHQYMVLHYIDATSGPGMLACTPLFSAASYFVIYIYLNISASIIDHSPFQKYYPLIESLPIFQIEAEYLWHRDGTLGNSTNPYFFRYREECFYYYWSCYFYKFDYD